MAELTYCLNCRRNLPNPLTSWKCFQALPVASDLNQSQEEGEQSNVEWEGEKEELDYLVTDTLCETFNNGVDRCRNPKCGLPQERGFYQKACPYCRMEIPEIGNAIARGFTVTGPSGSGKSHFIVALADWFNTKLPFFKMVATPLMSKGVQRTFDHMSHRVRTDKEVVPATEKDRMISYSWVINPHAHDRPGTVSTLPDVSGESLKDVNALRANRYYHHTNGIIFLIDGQTLLSASEGGEGARRAQDHVNVANAMVTDLTQRLGESERRRIPVAICVNKMDYLKAGDARWDQIERNPAFIPRHSQPSHQVGPQAFDHAVCRAREVAVRRLLYNNQAILPAISMLEASFDQTLCFTMSTIGSDDDSNVTWTPHGVEDPFLYLLWQYHYIGHIG